MTIKESLEAVRARREAARAEDKKALDTMFAAIFEAHPQVKTIYWTGYTPFFNDGDACEFSINEVKFSPVGWKEIDGPYFGDETEDSEKEDFDLSDYGGSTDPRVSPEMRADLKAAAELINEVSDTILSIYEDHHFIRVHSGGVERENYDHD